MVKGHIALILASFVMTVFTATGAVAQDKSIIQIYDLGASDQAKVVAVLQTMIPENDALAFLGEASSNKLIASATREEHLAIKKTLFHISNPVKEAITELPQHVAKRQNDDVFLSYAVPCNGDLESSKEIAENLLEHVDSARLDVDPKTDRLWVLAPWSTHVELGKRLFGNQE